MGWLGRVRAEEVLGEAQWSNFQLRRAVLLRHGLGTAKVEKAVLRDAVARPEGSGGGATKLRPTNATNRTSVVSRMYLVGGAGRTLRCAAAAAPASRLTTHLSK